MQVRDTEIIIITKAKIIMSFMSEARVKYRTRSGISTTKIINISYKCYYKISNI